MWRQFQLYIYDLGNFIYEFSTLGKFNGSIWGVGILCSIRRYGKYFLAKDHTILQIQIASSGSKMDWKRNGKLRP